MTIMDDGTAVRRIIRVKDSLASCSAKGGWRVGRGGVSGEGVSRGRGPPRRSGASTFM